jgi:hypothetical protein
MMDDEELAELGDDLKKRGQQLEVWFWVPPSVTVTPSNLNLSECQLMDGRNRLEAMERAGIIKTPKVRLYRGTDPLRIIIGLNIRRRHLTKEQKVELILKAGRAARGEAPDKPRQVDVVSHKGGRGKVNEVKAEAIAIAAEHGISKSTVERSIAKAEGRKPRRKPQKPSPGLKIARTQYAGEVARLPLREHGAEMERLGEAINAAIDARGKQ